jgi:hypothetical protein
MMVLFLPVYKQHQYRPEPEVQRANLHFTIGPERLKSLACDGVYPHPETDKKSNKADPK